MGRVSLAVIILSLPVLSLASAQSPSPGGDPLYRVGLATSDPADLEGQLLEHDYAIWSRGSAAVQVVVSAAEHQALIASGFNPVILETAQPLAAKLGAGSDGVPTGYHDLAAINGSLAATAATHPTIAKVVDVSTTFGPGPTAEGRSILVMKISDNVAQDDDEPNVLIVAAHHPYEIVNPEIALDIIAQLTTQYGIDPVITSLVDENEIWVAPVWNPDGLEHVWATNNFWRKNRRVLPGGEIGVNLNRNYDLGFDSTCSGSSDPANQNYKGPTAESEIETRTMVAFARDRRFAKVIDYHSSGREVLLSYRCSPMPAFIESYIDAEATALANVAGFGTRDPSADGEHQEWQNKEITSYAFLIETATNQQPSHADALAEAALVFPQTLAFLSRSLPVRGHVTEAATGLPLAADISVVGLNWQQGETRGAESRFGRYHLFLPAGTHQVTFSAPGFASQVHVVNVTATGETVLNVQLSPVVPDVGQPNVTLSSLTVAGAVDQNGMTPGPQNGPYFANLTMGDSLAMSFSGSPIQPFFLLFGPLNRNSAIFPGIGSVDIGLTVDFSDVGILMNGITPQTFLDVLAILNSSGEQSLSFSLPLPPGTSGTLQALIYQTSGLPLLTAATEISVY